VTAYLLDTNVVSELSKRAPAAQVVGWLGGDPDCALSVLTIGELRRGIRMLRGRDPVRARRLDAWVDELHADYRTRVLPVDAAVAEEWAALPADRTLPVVDSLIAATARVHGLTIATRNVRDFAGLDVRVFNPFV
jgi:predicted nucleic acid-binding protein